MICEECRFSLFWKILIIIALVKACSAPAHAQTERPRLLLPLEVTHATLQGLDVHSTLWAVRRGATEGNPLVGRWATTHPPLLIAVKTGTTAVTLYATERLWKTHPVRAVWVLIGLNAASTWIVLRNYRAMARLR